MAGHARSTAESTSAPLRPKCTLISTPLCSSTICLITILQAYLSRRRNHFTIQVDGSAAPQPLVQEALANNHF